MERWKGNWALVTGASAGIGRAICGKLAAGGTNLVLTARRHERIEQLAAKLSETYKIRAEFYAADLSLPATPDDIFAFTQAKGIQIDLLVNNAGFGAYGAFQKSNRAR
jgi:short-subunit dehydrogenase